MDLGIALEGFFFNKRSTGQWVNGSNVTFSEQTTPGWDHTSAKGTQCLLPSKRHTTSKSLISSTGIFTSRIIYKSWSGQVSVSNLQQSCQVDYPWCMLWFMWRLVPQVLHGDELCIYRGLQNVSWYCCKCGLPNFSTTLFDTMCFDDSNQFSPLSTTPVTWDPGNRHRQSISLFFTKNQKKSQRATKNGRNDIPLKVAVVNCRSIAKKKPELLNLLQATQADVIIGTESWLTDSISDSEICPPGYTMFRKDRASGIGVGVLLKVSSECVCSDPGFLCPLRSGDGMGSNASHRIQIS